MGLGTRASAFVFQPAVCAHRLVLATLLLKSTVPPTHVVACKAGCVSAQESSKRDNHVLSWLSGLSMTVPEGAFNFDLCKRNAYLEARGVKAPGYTKTGTTIAGIIFKDGVVLGADTRSTAGSTVADKNCEKIHYIAPNIYCCGAGTAADTENVTGMIASHLELHRYGTGRGSRVVTALTLLKSHLFKYQGHVSAALVLGGVDLNGPHLFTVYPHGSTDSLPYCTMGSGSLNAMAVFEASYKEDMTQEEAEALVARAIRSGIYNDLGSGSNVDLCIITKGKVDYKRNVELLMGKTYSRQKPVRYAPGTTPVAREKMVTLKDVAVIPGDLVEEAMDTS